MLSHVVPVGRAEDYDIVGVAARGERGQQPAHLVVYVADVRVIAGEHLAKARFRHLAHVEGELPGEVRLGRRQVKPRRQPERGAVVHGVPGSRRVIGRVRLDEAYPEKEGLTRLLHIAHGAPPNPGGGHVLRGQV